jgi:hypothetical protein
MLIFIQVLIKNFNLKISTKSQQDPFHISPLAMYQRKIPKRPYSSFSNQRSCKFKTKLKSKPAKQQYKCNFRNMNKKINIKKCKTLSFKVKL